MNAIEEILAKIKVSAITYLEKEKPLNWEVHVEELHRGAIMNLHGIDRIGRWVFNKEAMTLQREADLAPEVRSYGMIFKQNDNNTLQVIRDFWETESFDMD